jgi:uncharacterized protein (TIGR02246 family)
MRATLTLLWSLVLVVGVSGQAPGPRDGDERAVKDLVARYNAARDNEDPAAIRALFTADADQLVSSGEWRRGREQLVEGMLRSSRTNPGDRTLTVETVRFPTADVALADARYEIAGAAGAGSRRMWSTFVAVRTAEGWRLSAIRNMLPTR